MDLPAKNVVNIVNNTLNLIDHRLIGHGDRVATLLNRALVQKGGFDRRRRRDICMLAMLHDIGAYKTEEIDRIVHFESPRMWQHSIYGYLFLKYLSPLNRLAPLIFFHHSGCDDLRHLHPSYHELAQMLHLADRLDILSRATGEMTRDLYRTHFGRFRDILYRGDIVDLFDETLFSTAAGGGTCRELFDDDSFGTLATRSFLFMIVLSIDFRSPETVAHTMGVVRIADMLARLLGFDNGQAREIDLGALLHDLGKQGVPQSILESPGLLAREEMEVMKKHVVFTERILTGNVTRGILNIATRHHEKLNGAGYHRGLTKNDLSVPERLVAVADILSALLGQRSYKAPYSRAMALSIVDAMVRRGELDGNIVSLAKNNFDTVMEIMRIVSDETIELYDMINREYAELLELTGRFGRGDADWLAVPDELRW